MQGQLELPPGFRFHPTDDELVNHYLCTKCAAHSIAAPIIKEIDLYKFDPWQLPGTHLFLEHYSTNKELGHTLKSTLLFSVCRHGSLR